MGSTAELTATFEQEGAQYVLLNPGATNAQATEYALLKTFGNTINLYKAPLNANDYKPRNIDTTTKKVVDKPC